MTVNNAASYRGAHVSLHLMVLNGALTLFLSALLADIAYFNSFQIQWANFASWLIFGGMVVCGLALVFALFDLIRRGRKNKRIVWYFLLLICTWVVGLVNALEHAKDAWAVVPSGVIFSTATTLLICVSTWLGCTNLVAGDAK